MYSIKKVSELVNIPTVTIRAWENRYQVISPIRTEGGHRLYSQKDVETLRWLKEQVNLHHVKISDAVRQLVQSPEQPLNNHPHSSGYQDLKKQLYTALIQLDTQEANRISDLAFSLYDYEEVLQHILGAVLYEIGDDWEKGEVSVAQEHFSSQFILNRCTQFLRILPVNHQLPKVLALCPEGEQHHIGLMLFSLFLRKKGHEVIYLGPNTPLDGLMEIIKMKDISVIAMSMTTPISMEMVEQWIQTSLKTEPNLKFVLGGGSIVHTQHLQPENISYPAQNNWEDWYKGFIVKEME